MKKPAIKVEYNKNGDLSMAFLVGAFVLVSRKFVREVRRQTTKK